MAIIGRHALHIQAHLERQARDRKPVPESDQQDGRSHPGRISFDPARNSRGRERPHARQIATKPPTGQVHRTLYARPKNGGGPEEILAREKAALTERLRAAAPIRPVSEVQEWGARRTFPGGIIVEERAGALQTAIEWGAMTQSGPTAHAWTVER